jgi:transposase-like protein
VNIEWNNPGLTGYEANNMQQIRYPESFKIAVVREVLEARDSKAQIANRRGITQVTLRKWLEKYETQFSNDKCEEFGELEILRSRLEKITEERDSYKKALVLLAKDITGVTSS